VILKSKAALFDIEGTVGSISFVQDVLFPYARERIASFVRHNREEPEVRAILDMAAREAGVDVHDLPAIINALHVWSDTDVKVTPLKELQGLIWKGGFESGAIEAELYEDAVEAMHRFRAAGVRLFIYSSGSIAAQKMLFSNTTDGDLRPWIEGYFDTTTGPKKEVASYAHIASRMKLPPSEVVFFSDVAAELDAAREAGMQTVQLARPQDGVTAAGTHPAAETFAGITLER
jgi:enolase-phosphatase E1